MSENQADLDSLNSLLDIFTIEKKRDLERFCSTLTIRPKALTEIIFAGQTGQLEPLLYACYFGEHIPNDVNLSDLDHCAIGNASIGTIEGRARKAFNKIKQTFEVRRLFAAHLFYSPDHRYWYLFYWDQRDRETRANHWRGGSHVHLITDLWPGIKLEEIWDRVKRGDFNFSNKIHLRYDAESKQ